MRIRAGTFGLLCVGVAALLGGCGSSGSSGAKVGAPSCHWNAQTSGRAPATT